MSCLFLLVVYSSTSCLSPPSAVPRTAHSTDERKMCRQGHTGMQPLFLYMPLQIRCPLDMLQTAQVTAKRKGRQRHPAAWPIARLWRTAIALRLHNNLRLPPDCRSHDSMAHLSRPLATRDLVSPPAHPDPTPVALHHRTVTTWARLAPSRTLPNTCGLAIPPHAACLSDIPTRIPQSFFLVLWHGCLCRACVVPACPQCAPALRMSWAGSMGAGCACCLMRLAGAQKEMMEAGSRWSYRGKVDDMAQEAWRTMGTREPRAAPCSPSCSLNTCAAARHALSRHP